MTKEQLQAILVKSFIIAKVNEIELSDEFYSELRERFWLEFGDGIIYVLRNQLGSFVIKDLSIIPPSIPYEFIGRVWEWAYEKICLELQGLKVPFIETKDLVRGRKMFEFYVRELKQYADPDAMIGKAAHPGIH